VHQHDCIRDGETGRCFDCEAPMPRRGQPPKPVEEVASSHLHIRVTQAQKAAWVRQAQAEGMKLSAWVIGRLDSGKAEK